MTDTLRQDLQQRLGEEFRLERELVAGGMSRVFVAREGALGRDVVVKVLRPDFAASISAERFDREIQLAARLQDPRIVPVLRAGRVGELPFYTMPYVEGESLRARMAQSPIPFAEALNILRDVALALEYAHARHVVHRDIKPENILIAGRTAVVADFGIAKAIDAAGEPGKNGTLTMHGMTVGTPAYMAPEQAAGDVVDTRTDLYAWGVIAYELLTGQHPFASHTTAQGILAAHIAEAPPPVATLRRDLPAPLASLVDRCLAKNPGDRPQSAAEIIVAVSATQTLARRSLTPRRIGVSVAALAVLALVGTLLYARSAERAWARDRAIVDSERLAQTRRPLAAYEMLERAAAVLPGNAQIADALAEASRTVSINSSPSHAVVEIQDYASANGSWRRVGTTPLEHVIVPKGYFRWRLTRDTLPPYIVAPITSAQMSFALDTAAGAPQGMVWVGANTWADMIAFVGWVGPFALPSFYLDRFEVTNRQYQEFVDHGGYVRREYWQEKFVEHGRALTFEQASMRFRDRTGRPGPATWEGGHYPEGQADYPVSGVSWFEASAYAMSVGKVLPTFAQWFEAAPAGAGPYITEQSNMSHDRVGPVGSGRGLGPYGTSDMAGNVREWVINALDPDRRLILGGAWSAPSYLYAAPEALSPFDRAAENGFRCVRNIGTLPVAATRPVTPFDRDFAKKARVSDEVFRAYRALYAYPRTPLRVKAEGVVETSEWRREKVSFDAPYGDERITAYLYVPKRVEPPYQAIVFFPSARVLSIANSATLGDTAFFDFLVKSGRAVLYPIYQETYERRVRQTMPGGMQAIEVTVQRAKDVGRSIDYLASRADIDTTRLAYLGVSMGAAEGVIYAQLEQERLKTIVLVDGGFFLDPPPVGADQADFAMRITRPVLMVNGRFDFTFSIDKAQEPLFRMLGTPVAEKRHTVLDTPHDVRNDRPAYQKAVLDWLERYLGSPPPRRVVP